MPASLWSGNLRLSLVIIPVKIYSAVSTEEAIAFRQIPPNPRLSALER